MVLWKVKVADKTHLPVTWCLQLNTVILILIMIHRRRTAEPLTAVYLLMLVMKLFSGQALTCQPAEYQIGNECCPLCLAGSRVKKDCTEFKSTSCLPCLDGTFMNQPNGLKQCFTCTNCDEGLGLKIKSPCSTLLDAVCEPLYGFYCVEPSRDGCDAAKKHRSCGLGQYISQEGSAFSDSECSDCSDGTFSNGSFTSCQPHTQCERNKLQLLTPGTASTDAKCGDTILHTRSHWIIIIAILLFLLTLGLCMIFHFVKWKKCSEEGSKRRRSHEENYTMKKGDEQAVLDCNRFAVVVEDCYKMDPDDLES